MKRFLIVVLVIGVFLFTGCNNTEKPQPTPTDSSVQTQVTESPLSSVAPSPTIEAASALDYFPLNKDVYKKFKGTGNEYADFEIYTDFTVGDIIQQREINPGTTSIKVYKLSNAKVEQVYTRAEAYYRLNLTSYKNMSDVLIQTPIEVGTKWKTFDGHNRSITAVDKALHLPAGDYKALEITTEGDDSSKIKDYYVKGKGLVLTEYYDKISNTPMVKSELESFQNGETFKQEVRIYLPDYENDKPIMTTRTFEFKTNEDVKYKLQKELKTIPEKSNLSKVLTKNTKVLDVKLEEEKKTVTINLSKEFTDEMNLGSSFETLMMKCLVNTIGDYFGSGKVIITIEGKPYNSGHFDTEADNENNE